MPEYTRDALGRHVEPVLPARRVYTARLTVGTGTVPQAPTMVGRNRGMHPRRCTDLSGGFRMSKRDDQYVELTRKMLSDLPGEFLQFWEAVQGAVVDHVSENLGQFDDEILGEILTRVWERRGKYDSGKTGVMRWVKRQALDTAVMHNRKNDRFRRARPG